MRYSLPTSVRLVANTRDMRPTEFFELKEIKRFGGAGSSSVTHFKDGLVDILHSGPLSLVGVVTIV